MRSEALAQHSGVEARLQFNAAKEREEKIRRQPMAVEEVLREANQVGCTGDDQDKKEGIRDIISHNDEESGTSVHCEHSCIESSTSKICLNSKSSAVDLNEEEVGRTNTSSGEKADVEGFPSRLSDLRAEEEIHFGSSILSRVEISDEVLEQALKDLDTWVLPDWQAQVTFKVFDLGGQSTFYIFHPFFLTKYENSR